MLSTTPLGSQPARCVLAGEGDGGSKKPQVKAFPGLKTEVEPGKEKGKPSPGEQAGRFDLEERLGLLESLSNAAL